MCGIAGYFNPQATDTLSLAQIKSTTAALKHRGPDGDGYFQDPYCTLIHTRLAIIAPGAQGQQPFSVPDIPAYLIFNGEIFNYAELRKDLQASGISFLTDTDTEVLLRGMMLHGIDYISRLRGFFAFAFYRQDLCELLLARDHAGIKPCMYTISGNVLRFASESPALHCMGLPAEADPASLSAFLEFHFIPPERSAWKNIQTLPPGTCLQANLKGIHISSWQTLTDPAQSRDWTYGYGRMQQAVQRNLVSDIPLGIFLSSGLDSSLLARLAALQTTKPLHAFTLAFDQAYMDESHAAANLAAELGIEHSRVALLPDTALQWLMHMHEPIADPAGIATFRLAQAAREKHISVILAGDGADEVFGGYKRYTAWRMLQGIHFGLPLPGMPEGMGRDSGVQNLQRKVSRMIALARLPIQNRYRRLCAFHDMARIKDLISQDIPLYKPFLDFGSVRSVREVLDMDFRFLLPGNMLPKSDMSAMANSVEVRLPWLDEDLIGWMRTMPESAIRNKKILHAAWQHFSGKPFLNPKRGLDVPIEEIMQSGIVYEYWMDISCTAHIRNSGYFQLPALEALRSSTGDAELKWALLTWMHVVMGR